MNHFILKVLLSCSLAAAPVFATPPDGLLTSRTKLSLWTTAGVKSTAVHVDTDDGVVTLHGKVPTVEQKVLAEKTARAVGGVLGVRNLLQVVDEKAEPKVARADKETLAAVTKTLKDDASLKNTKISVKSVDNGVVLLTGDARTFSEHLRAVLVADRTPGVRHVTSEIKGPEAFGDDERVATMNKPDPKTGGPATDMRISAAVKLRLLTAPHVPSAEISVDTDESVVTLFGIVPTNDVKQAAGDEAAKVFGVQSVHNQLEVVASNMKQQVEAKDTDVSRDLGLAFKDRVDFKDITTTVKNGSVRLSGSVATGWDEMNAVRVARRVAGVKLVENQLKVDEKPSPATR